MSEKIIASPRTHICDLCGHPIPRYCKCRMIVDDYMPFMTCYEHLRCPTGTAVVSPRKPKNPVKTNCLCEPALA